MIGDVQRLVFVLASSASSGALAAIGSIDEHTSLLAAIVATVTVVAGGIAWLDRRMEKKIRDHERKEFEKDEQLKTLNAQRYEARRQFEEERHASILREIAHVKELIDLRSEIRALREPNGP